MELKELKELKIPYNNNELNYKFAKNDLNMNKILITFDNNIYNSTNELNPGEVNIHLKNPNILEEVQELLKRFYEEILTEKQISPNLVIVFIINKNNKEQEDNLANQIIQNTFTVPLEVEVVYKDDLTKTTEEEIIKQQQELQDQPLTATGTKNIQKEGINGEIQNYIKNNDIIYEDNDILSINEQKQQSLQTWLNDENKKAEIENLTPEELGRQLTENVTTNKTEYVLDYSTEANSKNTELENVSNSIAYANDGKVNAELGIIENSPENPNQFTTVEETNTQGYKIGTPTVTEGTITSNSNISASTTNTTSSNEIYYETSLSEEETEQREIENIYYTDSDYNIYNNNGELIGTLSSTETGYAIDENNNLTKNGQILGPIENIRDMELNQSKQKNNIKQRVLKQNANGYISLMFISIGISIILLIYVLLSLI